MRLPSPIVAGSIAIAVFAGGFAVGHFINDNGGSTTKASGKPRVLGQVFTPDSSTTTTAAAQAPTAPPSSQASTHATTATAAQPSAGTQSTTPAATPTQTASPPATSTVAGGDCGNGSAAANVAAHTFPQSEAADTDYETDINVSVHNGVDKPIQIDSLSVHLVYTDGGTQDVVFSNAIGNVVQPGVTNNYGIALNTGKRQVAPNNGVSMQSFTFHTAGHPECPGRPA